MLSVNTTAEWPRMFPMTPTKKGRGGAPASNIVSFDWKQGFTLSSLSLWGHGYIIIGLPGTFQATPPMPRAKLEAEAPAASGYR